MTRLYRRYAPVLFMVFCMQGVLLMAVNYWFTDSAWADLPFRMQLGYRRLLPEGDGASLPKEGLLKLRDVRVVAALKEAGQVAVYDPQMRFYLRSSKVLGGDRRYFSDADYRSGRDVGIAIAPLVALIQAGRGSELQKYYKEWEGVFDVIQIFDAYSDIGEEGGVLAVRNLFAVPASSIREVYVDADSEEARRRAAALFSDAGYRDATPEKKVAFSQAVAYLRGEDARMYVSRYLEIAATAWIAVLVVFFGWLQCEEKRYWLTRLYGATARNLRLEIWLPFLGWMACVCGAMGLLYYAYGEEISKNSLSPGQITAVCAVFAASVMLVLTLRTGWIFRKICKEM